MVAEHAVPRSAFLADLSKLLASSLDYETTLRNVARAPLPEFADWCVVDVLDDDGSIQRLAVAHIEARQEALIWQVARACTPQTTAIEGMTMVLRAGRAQLIQTENEPMWSELGAGGGIIAPMLVGERVLGALSLGAGRDYCEADLAFAEELASRCAQALENARLYRLARQAIELRDMFVATISHDLKNPLATIGGQAQLLRRLTQLDERDQRIQRLQTGIQRIQATVERMSRMVDGLLDITRLEVDLVDIAKRVATEHQERAPRHHIQVAGETSLIGSWDLARIERVLDNLIGNAVKYSPGGGVITIVCVRESDEAGAWAILSVRDQGVGIPASDIGRIFERFQRAGNVHGISGTGIGLATISEVVEQHGGTITVDSTEGRGSTFTIRLPIDYSGMDEAASAVAPPG
jgi:signal transduction histidine kinase